MGRTIFFCNPGQNLFNYFHFLLDCGLQLFIMNKKKVKVDNLILFSEKNIHREKFIKIFFPKINIIYCNANETITVKKLVFLSPFYLSTYLSTKSTQIFKKYKIFLVKKLKILDLKLANKKIFINRKESRQVSNLVNFKDTIKFKETFFSSNESIKSQSDKIQKASIIIGLHGAGLTNILFSNKRSKIIELLPEYYPSSVFERLSKALELSYKNIILKKNHFNRTMITERDIKKISKFIKKKKND